MKCGGCDRALAETEVAAFAIMNKADIAEGVEVAHQGVGKYHAVAVCKPCHVDPAHRIRPLKAHFALPDQLGPILGFAGYGNQVATQPAK